MDQEKSSEWLIDNIAEASKNARKIYLLFIGFLAYCTLTIVSTTDREIILNETARLPIINIDVSIFAFFISAPLLALFIFVYLQLYIHRLKGLITDLRTNYSSVEKRRLYPWMLNIAEDPEPGIMSRLQKIIVNFSLWWLLPIVLILFPLGFLRKHDPYLSYVIGLIPVIGTAIVIWFWCQYEQVKLKRFIRRNPGKTSLSIMVLYFGMNFIFGMIPSAFDGDEYGFLSPLLYVDLSYQKLINEQNEEYETLYWVDLAGANLVRANFTGSILKRADFRNSNLRKAEFSGANVEGASLDSAQLEGAILIETNLDKAKLQKVLLQDATLKGAWLRGADLSNAQLEGANLWNSKLQDAVLERAQLDSANLQLANLQGANLYGAQLKGADLSLANLRGAKLQWAHLQGANLQLAHLENANFEKAELQGADLSEAHLDSAYLYETHLENADLFGAQLQGAYLFLAHLQNAELNNAQLKDANLDNANLEKVNLSRANLQGANLAFAKLDSANLQYSQFKSANLKKAQLRGADLWRVQLQGVKNLTIEQLSKVKTLYEAKLDSALLEGIKRDYPHLLEESKEN